MVTQNQEVYKVDYQHAENNGKLIAGHQCTPDIGWCYFGNIHRTDGRCQPHTDTTYDAVKVKGYKQVHISFSIFKEQELGVI